MRLTAYARIYAVGAVSCLANPYNLTNLAILRISVLGGWDGDKGSAIIASAIATGCSPGVARSE